MTELQTTRRILLQLLTTSAISSMLITPTAALSEETQANDRKSIAKDIFKESVLYHSKLKNTSDYFDILSGLETLAIEGQSYHIDEVIGTINDKGSSVLSDGLTLFGLVSGSLGNASKVGRLAKNLRILDKGVGTVEKYLSGDETGRVSNKFEYRIGEITDLLWERSENDPLLRDKLNGYLPPELGGIGFDYDEIIQASVQFSDNKEIQFLVAAGIRQDEIIGNVLANVDKFNDFLSSIEAKELSEAEYAETVRSIDEFEVYGRLASKLLGLSDKNAGSKVGALVSSFAKVSKVASALSAKKIGAGLATANYASIALDLFSAFGDTGPTDAEIILDGISKLQEYIAKSTELVLTQLEAINESLVDIQYSLAQMYQEVLRQGLQLDDLQLKVRDLEQLLVQKSDLLLVANRAGFRRDLEEAIVSAVGHKEIWSSSSFVLGRAEYQDLLILLYSHAAIHSADALSTAIAGDRRYGPEHIFDEINESEFVSSTPYLSRAVSQILQTPFPVVNIDPAMWTVSTMVLLDLIGDWPEYQGGIKTEFLEEVRERGRSFEEYLRVCHPNVSKSALKNLVQLAAEAANASFHRTEGVAFQLLEEMILSRGRTVPRMVSKPDMRAFDVSSFSDLFEEDDVDVSGIMATSAVSYDLYEEGRGNSNQKYRVEVDDGLRNSFPKEVKAALWLGAELEISATRFPIRFGGGTGTVRHRIVVDVVGPERRYRVLDNQGEITTAGLVGGAANSPEMLTQLFSEYYFPIIWAGGDESGQENANEGLAGLRDWISDACTPFCREIETKTRSELERSTDASNEISSHGGLLELCWRTIVMGTPLADQRQFEHFFIGSSYPKLDLTGFLIDQSIGQISDNVLNIHQEICEALDTGSYSQQQKLSVSDESPLGFMSVMKRLEDCINTLENGRLWKSDYALSREAA